ncbi:MAG: branched-chain amino acid ABC transporter permease [Oscillospiraceae bacterium]
MKKAIPYAVILLCFLVVPVFTQDLYWLGIMIMLMYKTIGSVSLRTIALSGNLSFSHGSFIALGAYCTGILAKELGLPPAVTLLAGALFACLMSVITGLPFVRLRGVYYCMASMFLGVAIIYVIQALKITGGYRGLTSIPPMFDDINANYYFFLALTVFSLAAMYRFEHSRIGVTLRALAQSQEVAASIGINSAFFKLLSVGFGSFFAGLAGAGFALYSTVLSTTNYAMTFSLWLLMYMMIGGMDKFIGPILGTIVFVMISELSRDFSSYAPYLSAAAMLVVAYLIPGGLAGIPDFVRSRRGRTKRMNFQKEAE